MAFDLAGCPSGWSEATQLAGRTIVGVGSGPGLTPRGRQSSFGSETETLTVAQMPSHGHRVWADMGTSIHDHVVALGRASDPGLVGKDASVSKTYSNVNGSGRVVIEPSGGGQPHNNVQPSYALLYCKKI